jgi:hypothetical protein
MAKPQEISPVVGLSRRLSDPRIFPLVPPASDCRTRSVDLHLHLQGSLVQHKRWQGHGDGLPEMRPSFAIEFQRQRVILYVLTVEK